MRIISKFKDYYDYMQAYGQDPKIVYLRQSRNEPLNNIPDDIENNWYRAYYRDVLYHILKLDLAIIGVAGKFYPIVYKSGMDYTKTDEIGRYIISESFFDVDSIIKYVDTLKFKKTKREQIIKELERSPQRSRYSWFYSNNTLRQFFDFFSNYENEELFKIVKSPVIMISRSYRGWRLDVDIMLSKYKLGRVLDGGTAYTSIEFFLSNVLKIADPDTVEIGDEYKLEQHGFGKCSFKTRTPGKKRKRSKRTKSVC